MGDMDIRNVGVGDIVGASGEDVENVCIVSEVDEKVVRAWVVNGQYDVRFDRTTGRALADYGRKEGFVRVTFAEELPDNLDLRVRALDATLRAAGGDPEKAFEAHAGGAVVRLALSHMAARRTPAAAAAVVPTGLQARPGAP